MKGRVLVAGVGARAALGLDARQIAMSTRAGWFVPSRRALPPDGEGQHRAIGVSFCRSLPAELTGPDRLLAIAQGPIAEALEDAIASGLDEELARAPLPVCLALPELRVDDAPGLGRPLLDRMGELLPGGLDPRRSEIVRAGHAGFGAIARRAIERVLGAGDAPAAVLLGGVDSYAHDGLLVDLEARRRVLGARSVDGFVPGEGAGFAIVANAAALSSPSAASPYATLGAAAVLAELDESHADYVCGTALTGCVEQVAPQEGGFGWVIIDLTPEQHRHKEWTMVAIRRASDLRPDVPLLRLGDELGDLGAASGAIGLAIACIGMRTGFAPTGPALLLLSSERSERGAVRVDRLPPRGAPPLRPDRPSMPPRAPGARPQPA